MTSSLFLLVAQNPLSIVDGVTEDAQLLGRFKEGDEAAFDSIVRAYYERVF